MKIVRRKLSELKPAEYNPRRLTAKQEQDLTASLTKFGLVDPVIINTNPERKDVIIGGHQRLKIWRKLGNTEIDCVEFNLNVEQERELNVRLNKNIGEFDFDILQSEFKFDELIEWGFESDELWDIDELEAIEDDFNTAPESETLTVLGDLYEIGEHRLLCGDSTDSDSVAKLMNGEKADMVFTDPPYDLENEEYHSNIFLFSKNAHVFVMHDDKGIVNYLRLSNLEFLRFYVANFRFASPRGNDPYLQHILISQEKNGDAIKHQNHHDSFRSIIPLEYRFTLKDEKTGHKHQKPIKFISIFIKHFSYENKLILDLFLGSGTTMVAAHQLNRKCYGMELDPHYCDVIIRRMLNLDPTLEVKRNGKDCRKEFINGTIR